MPLEMLDKTNQFNGGDQSVLSARKAADFLGLSKAVFFAGIDSGAIQWQARIQDSPQSKPAYGFYLEYLKEVRKVLSTHRTKTQKVFNPEVKSKIEKINKRWYERLNADWELDMRETMAAISPQAPNRRSGQQSESKPQTHKPRARQ